MGQIREFLRSVSVDFDLMKLILNSPRFVPIGANNPDIPEGQPVSVSLCCSQALEKITPNCTDLRFASKVGQIGAKYTSM